MAAKFSKGDEIAMRGTVLACPHFTPPVHACSVPGWSYVPQTCCSGNLTTRVTRQKGFCPAREPSVAKALEAIAPGADRRG